MTIAEYKKSKYSEVIPAYIGLFISEHDIELTYKYACRYNEINDKEIALTDRQLCEMYSQLSLRWDQNLSNFINHILPLKTVSDCEKAAVTYCRMHWTNGGSSEFDSSINDISRRAIELLYKEKGAGFLGKINYYEPTELVDLIPYDENLIIKNFQFGFIVPVYDQKLIRLIVENRKSGSEGLIERLREIISYISEIGGIHLNWS